MPGDSPGRSLAGGFPPTRLSVVAAVKAAEPEIRRQAFESLISLYWRPVYKYLRVRWQVSGEDARDLTQDFFARAMEKDFFERYDPARARFRTFLRTCLDGFAANQRKAERRIKRGGQVSFVSLDFDSVEREVRPRELASTDDVEEYFHREWIRGVFWLAVEALRKHALAHAKTLHFALFELYDLDPDEGDERPTYQALAERFEISVTDVTNHLAWARRELRRLVLERLREACASDEEFRSEARHVLGIDLP